ncbi:hypothetical protein PROFUN_13622 [Planoprotostelium fungivorum]|uniref:DOMON domain-containing protein n=1 Tax=Planoprotostelium fungivorum TaxID=1890364 RepID=A0A2P6MZU3_9EUKA|nr:hypothetical protein PROFUN_13622 [Planoprotostelium fungivorum]
MRWLILFAIFCALVFGDASNSTDINSGTITTDGTWTAVWTKSADKTSITFNITAQTTGWVGIGFNSVGLMGGADITTSWITNNAVTIFDAYATMEAQPQPDTKSGGSNDVSAVSGSESATSTTVVFTRPMAATDKNDNAIQGKIYVLWAWGTQDGVGDASSPQFPQHERYGSVQINFGTRNNATVVGSSGTSGGQRGTAGKTLTVGWMLIFCLVAGISTM